MSEVNYSGEQKDSKKTAATIILIFGIIWILCGTFGLIFDPERKLIITFLYVLGVMEIVLYFFIKPRKNSDSITPPTT